MRGNEYLYEFRLGSKKPTRPVRLGEPDEVEGKEVK